MRRYLKIALILTLMIAVPYRRMHAGAPQFDPIPLPDIPFPDDPPDLIDIPFPDPPDFPDPIDLPPFPEDPIDFPLPDPWELPDPPDLPDPFDLDEPSLFPPDPFDDLPDPFDGIPPPPAPAEGGFPAGFRAGPVPAALGAASTPVNALSRLMPFPNRLPFHPAYSGVNAPASKPKCDAATASTVMIAETYKNTVAVYNTCPPALKQRITVGNGPIAVKVTPDGKSALVSNYVDGTVSVIDLASMTTVATIPLPPFNGFGASPTGITILPDGSRAYVNNHDANPGSVVYVIDLATRTVIKQIAVGAFPASIRVTPDGTQVWVPCRGDSDLFVIDTLTNTVVGFNPNIMLPTGVVFTPNGTKAYVAEGIEGGGYVDQIDMTTFQITSRIVVGMLPHSLAISPSGHDMFVTNAFSNTIMRINVLTNTVVQTIKVPGKHPLGLLFIR